MIDQEIKPKRKYTRHPGSNAPGKPKIHDDLFIDALGKKLEAWMITASESYDPRDWWLGEFAVKNNLYDEALSEFAGKNEKFAKTLKKAKQVQKNRIVLLSMLNKINTTMAIFALKNVSGWRDMPEAEKDTLLINANLVFADVHKNEADQDKFKRFYN
jgi:hypothetical protein